MFRIILSLVVVCLSVGSTTAAEKSKHVLLLGIDGCRFDALTKAKTPNLDKLMENGSYSSSAMILGDRYKENDTVSGPGWGSIVTGVWADKHNVQDNNFKEPHFDKFPHFFHWVKQQLPEAKTISIINWSPIKTFMVSSADISIDTTSVPKAYQLWDNTSAAQAVELIEKESPTAMMLYFGEVDESGHAHGFHPSVPEYIAAIEHVDSLVGKVLEAIEKKTDQEWLVVVTSDHGGLGTGHGGGHDKPEILNSFLIVSGDGAEKGTFNKQVYIVDAVPTCLAYLGLKIDEAWQLDGHPVGLKSDEK